MFTHRKSILWTILLLAVVLLNSAGDVRAEAVVNGSATATILAALTVTADSSLRFGNILQGVPVTVSNASNDSSGVFRVSGQAAATIWVSLTLPAYMSHNTNAQDRMDCFFGTTAGAWNSAASAQPATAGATTYDPHTSFTQALGAGGDLAVFLGGKVYPKVNQTAGAYTGDIVLTVIYTGV